MGESHQFFLIARIEPHGGGKAQYRCIGALNAQWYHGSMPVSAARRLIQLLRVPDNAQIVQEELRAIAGNYGAHGATEPVIPARPCPYTLFLANLAVHASFTPGDLHISISGSHRAAVHAGAGVWSHGHSCTVFDVTDAGRPTYCHLRGPSLMSAREYIGSLEGRVIARIIAAGPEIEEDENFDEDMRYFRELATFRDDVPMIEPEALSQAWPQSLAPLVPEDASAGSEDMCAEDDNAASETAIPSLTDLTIGPSVRQVVEAGDLSGIAPLLDQPDKLPRIRDALREISPFPDTGIPVLQELVAHCHSDAATELVGMQLTGPQVARLLDGKPVDVLDLSGNATLDVDGLRDLLVRVPSIRRLVLFRTGVPSDALLALLHTKPALFYRISELVHPALLSWPFKTPKEWTTAFAIEAVTPGMAMPGFGGVKIPMLSPAPLLRGLTRFMRAVMEKGSECGPGAGDAVLEAAITGGAGGDWDSRSVWCTPMPARVTERTADGWTLALHWSSPYERRSALGGAAIMVNGAGVGTAPGQALIHSLLGGGAPPPPPNFAPMYGFIHETSSDGWLAKGRRWEMLDARGFLRELVREANDELAKEKKELKAGEDEPPSAGLQAPFTGLLSYAGGFFGTTRQDEGRTALPEEEGLPALPEDIEHEFLAVVDEAGRRSGLLDLAKYHEMSFNLHMNQEQRRSM